MLRAWLRVGDEFSVVMFTSQMIVNGTVKPKEIVKAFAVPIITVKPYVKTEGRSIGTGTDAVGTRTNCA
jgi:hypothetical protein